MQPDSPPLLAGRWEDGFRRQYTSARAVVRQEEAEPKLKPKPTPKPKPKPNVEFCVLREGDGTFCFTSEHIPREASKSGG